METWCNIKVDVKDIVDDLNREQAKEIIKHLDSKMADWGFTLEMCRYFLGEMKEEFEAAGGEGFNLLTVNNILAVDSKQIFPEGE